MSQILLTPKQFGEQLNPPISAQRVLDLCKQGRIIGATKIGRFYVIPSDAKDLRDRRFMKIKKKK